MPRLLLTDRFVAGAKPAAEEAQTYYFDSKTPGLALRVSDSHKGWTFTFTAIDGKRTRTTLGTYPALSLSAARTKAVEARGWIEDGRDPRSLVRQAGAARITVAELAARYFDDPDKAKLKSLFEVRRRLTQNALPIIGHIALAELTKRDVKDVTDKILRRGAPSQAWHTHKDLSTLLRWAVR